MKRPTRIALFSALVLVSAGALWNSRGNIDRPAPVLVAADADIPPLLAPDALPAPIPVAASAPLPAPGAPLSEIAASLQQRADAGDRNASCRLGVELLLCDQLEKGANSLQGQLEAEERQVANSGELQKADRIAEMQLRAIARRQQCAARPDHLKGAGWRYLRQAALAGQRDAVLLYAEGQLLFTDYSFARTPEFDVWRREMPALLQRELARGNPDMPSALLNLYSHDLNLGSGLIPDDPVLAEAYRLLRDRLLGRSSSVDRSLDAEATQRSQALAARWHADHYGNRRFPRDPWIEGHHMLPLRLVEMQAARDLPICDRS